MLKMLQYFLVLLCVWSAGGRGNFLSVQFDRNPAVLELKLLLNHIKVLKEWGRYPEEGKAFVINVCVFLERYLRAESITAQSTEHGKLDSNWRMKNMRADVWK